MKRIIIISLVALFISFTASAQENRKAKVFQMSMFANIGTKTLNFKNLENIPMPKVGYNLGAGAYWSYKSILFSSDFYYSQASEENSVNKTNYNAFANTLYLGYKVIDNYYITLAPLAGIAITNNKISVYDKNFTGNTLNSTNAYTITNHDFALRLGLNFEAVVYHENTIGIVLGYDHSFKGNSEWQIEGTNLGSGISDNLSGFFINITIGGRLFLTEGMNKDTKNSIIIE